MLAESVREGKILIHIRCRVVPGGKMEMLILNILEDKQESAETIRLKPLLNSL